MNQHKWDIFCLEDQEAITAVSGETIARNVSAAVGDYDILTQAEVAEHRIPVVRPDAAFLAALEARASYAWIARANPRGVDGAAVQAIYLEQVAAANAELGL